MNSNQNSTQLIEARLISTFCTYPEAWETYVIDEDIFLYKAHKEIWKVISNVYQQYKEFDLNKAVDGLNACGVLDYFVGSVLDQTPSMALIDDDIKYLDNKYKIRCAQVISTNIEDFDALETELNTIQSYYSEPNGGELPDVEEIFKIVTTPSNSLKFNTWYMQQFDITPNTLNIIGARTGKGKTAFSLNLAYELSQKYRVLYFNLENPKNVILQRLISMDIKLTKNELRALQNDSQRNMVLESIYKLKGSGLRIYDSIDAPNLEQIRKIIKLASKKEMVIVFIDNVNNMRSLKQFGSIREEINHVTKELLNIKASTNCIIFALAQLRRPQNENLKPSERDLKESGSLEEDADNVFLLHECAQLGDSKEYFYKLFTPKSRNEANAETLVIFDKAHQIFRDTTQREEMIFASLENEEE